MSGLRCILVHWIPTSFLRYFKKISILTLQSLWLCLWFQMNDLQGLVLFCCQSPGNIQDSCNNNNWKLVYGIVYTHCMSGVMLSEKVLKNLRELVAISCLETLLHIEKNILVDFLGRFHKLLQCYISSENSYSQGYQSLIST